MPASQPAAVGAVTMAALHTEVRRVLAGAKPGRTCPPGVGAADYRAAVERHRLLPLLASSQDGQDEQGERATGPDPDDLVGLMRMLALKQLIQMERATSALDAAGVRVLHVKGLCLAVQTTGDPMARGPGDVDLFVHPADVAAAHASLSEAGWRPKPGFPTPGPTWAWRHTIENYFELGFLEGHAELDLHWRLDPSPSATPDFDAAWAERQPVEVLGRTLDTLSPRHAFRHSVAHSARDDWRWLRSLVDVHRLAGRPDLWESLPHAELRRVELMTLAVVEASIGLPPAVPEEVRDRIRGPRWQVAVRRGLARQLLPDDDRHVDRVPAGLWPLMLRRNLRAAGTPDDVRRVLTAMVFMPHHLGAVEETSAAAAVPHAVAARVGRAYRVLRDGRVADETAALSWVRDSLDP